MANDAHLVPDDQLFAAGDVRANENIELTSLQTLFVREHNRIADADPPRPTPASTTRRSTRWPAPRSSREIQVITYNEWLPALLGPGALPAVPRLQPDRQPRHRQRVLDRRLPLRPQHARRRRRVPRQQRPARRRRGRAERGLLQPARCCRANGIDPILKYLASDPSSELDNTVVDSVRNFLFGPPGAGGLDLASLNIQRGRDHGLADYNTIRAAYGLPRVTSFAQITSNTDVQDKLQSLYGSVDNIDAWVGALAEDHVAGGSTGPADPRRCSSTSSRGCATATASGTERTFSGTALRDLEQDHAGRRHPPQHHG